MNEPKIKRVAPWAGGKSTLAPKIVEHLGNHKIYFEPFVGGCSIIPRKPISKVECLNDKNPKIINVLKTLRDDTEWLQNFLDETEFSKSAFESAVYNSGFFEPTRLQAAGQLIAWWMGPNGLAGTKTRPWFAQRHTKTGGDPKVRWHSFRESVRWLSQRIQGCTFHCVDFREFYADNCSDEESVSWYCDSPYLQKNIEYEFDFAEQDHVDLSRSNNKFERAKVVVSYYAEPYMDLFGKGDILTDLYPPSRWDRIEIEMSKNSASASGKAKRATEILLVNRREQ